MTAELSQLFRTKREGVAFVLDAVSTAFPSSRLLVYTVDGRFLDLPSARADPIAVAASNWAATARGAAMCVPDAILLDIGTTTTDIIPIVEGRVAAIGRTDVERLATGELAYSGAVRTPVEALTHDVRLRGETVGVSAEAFALAGDVHLWRGTLAATDYTAATPDGRPATRELAGERLARVVCGDRELLDASDIDAIAACAAEAQVERIAAGIQRVRARHPSLQTALVTGVGDFIAVAAAERSGLDVVYLAEHFGNAGARTAPAAAVALLLAQHLEDFSP